jgi:hypothetical protein
MRKRQPRFSVESRWRAPGLAALAIALASLLAGCGAACDTADEGNPPEHYAGGTGAAGVYESSGWKSGLLPFPGGKQYQLDHHLGFTPANVDLFIGFGPDGERVAPCAGNSCLVRCVDDQIIWIKNDTCADFWIRVAAQGKSFESRGGGCTDGGVVDGGASIEAAPDAQEETPVDGPASDQGSIDDATRTE